MASSSKTPANKSQAASFDIAKSDETLDLAKDLANFIKENKLSTQVQGKEFVNVEGWQYAGSRLGIVPIVEHVINLSTDQELKYQAKVTLFDLRHATTVGAGFAVCSNKEGGKKFYQEFAIASMAQTRAIGKAYRNILAWIIRAAGYEPTPAEEMEYSGNVPTPAPAGTEQAPVMHASTPGDPLAASQPPVQYATAQQKETIIRLLDHPLITRQEKTKMLLNINRLDEDRAEQAIKKLNRAIEDREGTSAVAEPVGNEPAGAPSVTPAGLPFADPAASTTSDQSNEAQVAAVMKGATLELETEQGAPHLVARYPSGSASPEATYSTPEVAEYARQFSGFTSSLAVNELKNKLTGGERKELKTVIEAALDRIKRAVADAAATAVRTVGTPMRATGNDASLVAEFEQQPKVEGASYEPATKDQREAIQRLCDHPTVTRVEKTKMLLTIYKLDTKRARQALLKLRLTIAEREGVDPREGSRAQLKSLVAREGKKLSTDHADRLLALAAEPEATLEALVDALTDAQNVLIDDETYGTDEELAAAGDETQLAA